MNDLAESFMQRPPFSSRKLRYFTDFAGSDSDGINTAILDAINGVDGVANGAALVQYAGHGNFDLWSDDAFFDDTVSAQHTQRDTDLLVNGTRLPWLLAHNCLTGGFHTPAFHAMGEDWIKRAGGGAVAVFAPSGLSFVYIGERVTQVVWGDLFGPKKERGIAVPVMDALTMLCAQGSVEPCQYYILLGDPSMTLTLPSVAPPTLPVATPSSLRVDLAWAASASPSVTYDVYRTTALVTTAYVKLNAAPVAGTAFADTTVSNAATYYYYVVARDAQGYESRWSNFNSDCAVSGLDCLKATPLNPNPPSAPVDVAVTDAETGGRLTVSWTANTEPDIKSYTIWWGAAAGQYSQFLVVPKPSVFASLSGLANGVPYYFAVTATNTSTLTSGLSAEAVGVPSWVRGVKSPAFIRTLRVNRSGPNARLTWDSVTTNIYGKAAGATFYEVFRGTTPDFVPSMLNRVAFPVLPTFDDPGALAAPGTYYYLVRAVDAEGNVGGLGSQLPNGIDALHATPSLVNPGKIVLSWPAVTTTFDGDPAVIVRYNVYVSSLPFSRDDIRNGVITTLTTATSPSVEITPSAGNQYYSVLAVDARANLSPF